MPDISEWNTQNVTDMKYIFSYCKSLKSLPDISKWNIQKVNSLCNIFDGCNEKLKTDKIIRKIKNKKKSYQDWTII